MLWVSSLLWVYEKVKCPPPPYEFHYEPLFVIDTVVTRSWEFEGFQFYLKHITKGGYPTMKAFTSVHINSTDECYFLFDCHWVIDEMGAEPERLFDDVYSYPYYTGGNYSRSSGIDLFRVRDDTAIYLGPVVGYEDIDDDGVKEFYLYVVSEFGEGAAFNKFEKLEVTLEGDFLVYPFLDGAY